MPRFFIDTHDGDQSDHDDEGLEFPDAASARSAALAALPDMAREKIMDGDFRRMSVSVRDHAGVHVYGATMTFRGGWVA